MRSVVTELMAVRMWRAVWGPMADRRDFWQLLMAAEGNLFPMDLRRCSVVVVVLRKGLERKAGQMSWRGLRDCRKSRTAAQS